MKRLLMTVAGMLLFLSAGAHAQSQPKWHLVEFDRRSVQVTSIVTLHFDLPPAKLVLATMVPPALPSQQDIEVTARFGDLPIGTLAKESSALHRPYLRTDQLPITSADPVVTVSYKATIIRRRLMPGPPLTPPAELSELERKETLSTTAICNFNLPSFRGWLAEQRLLMAAPQEDDIDFAYRVFCYIKNRYTYSHDKDSGAAFHTADYLRKQTKADCGELVEIFGAIMRANNIPYRIKVGRLLKTDISHAYGVQQHVRGDFWARGVGWVPLEISVTPGVTDDTFMFGYDRDLFLTSHVETGMVFDSKFWGLQPIDWSTVTRCWSPTKTRAEPNEDWIVDASPARTSLP